jgi:Uma2 family endonuclease
VVEILSHSTARIDRTRKASRYADLGIVHYWIVDPVARVIECYRLTERKYQAVAMAGQGEPLTHPDWPDLAIDTVALWADSPARPAS